MRKSIFFCLMTVLLISCDSGEKNLNKKNDEPSIEINKMEDNYLSKIRSFLPTIIDPSEFILIYRFGSIQWTPYSSVLCMPIDKTKPWSYLQFNIGMESNFVSSPTEPKMSFFQFKMETTTNPKDFTSLPLLSDKEFEFIGEGYCSNLFVLELEDKRYLLNEGDSDLLDFFQNIYRRISKVEHIQSLSLQSDCNDLDSLAISIIETTDFDKYILKFDRKIDLW